jgi:hypothetical protein
MSKDEMFAVYMEYLESSDPIEKFAEERQMSIDNMLKTINDGCAVWHGDPSSEELMTS